MPQMNTMIVSADTLLPRLEPCLPKLVKQKNRDRLIASHPQKNVLLTSIPRKAHTANRRAAVRASEQEVLVDQDFVNELNQVPLPLITKTELFSGQSRDVLHCPKANIKELFAADYMMMASHRAADNSPMNCSRLEHKTIAKIHPRACCIPIAGLQQDAGGPHLRQRGSRQPAQPGVAGDEGIPGGSG